MRQGIVGLDLRPEDFHWITAQIRQVAEVTCQGRVVSVLEGGYGQPHDQPSPKTASPFMGCPPGAAPKLFEP